MSDVPLPVRVAVGLLVTAVEQARKLPEQLADFPVTAASRAVQAGMRMQQRVTELAIKGDEVFSLLRPVQDTPPWARFDEDDEQQPGTTFNEFGGSDVGEADAAGAADVARGLSSAGPAVTGARPASANSSPPALPEYAELSLTQLRRKLRGLSLPQLAALLEYEHVHQDRAAFITMLSNRIATVRAQ